MTTYPIRRADRVMDEQGCIALLERCTVGHLGTVGPEGQPYVTPMNYVFVPSTRRIYLHLSTQRGHLLTNLEHSPRVCFEVERAGPVVQTGDTGCDASQVYQSVICFGTARTVTGRTQKAEACKRFNAKYAPQIQRSDFPRLDDVLILAIAIDRMTGKRRPMPKTTW